MVNFWSRSFTIILALKSFDIYNTSTTVSAKCDADTMPCHNHTNWFDAHQERSERTCS